MTSQAIARGLLAVLCGLQGLATIVIDLNRTHASNPLWPGHARFHVVWQTSNTALLAGLEIVLLFMRGPFEIARFYLVAALAGIPMVGFLIALALRKLYRGKLSDSNGMPQASIRLFAREQRIDLNTAAVAAGLVCLMILVWYGR